MVYVAYDQTEDMALSDRIFLIKRGVVQRSGKPEEIYNCPINQFAADFLGFPPKKGTGDNEDNMA